MVKGIRVVYYRRKWSSSFDPGGIGGWVAGFVNTDTDRNKGQLRRINSVQNEISKTIEKDKEVLERGS